MTTRTEKFSSALLHVAELHRGQQRKGTEIPYLTHLLSVASLVLEAGGDEDQAIAALFHDALEDQGERITERDLRQQYGDRVARIVCQCSEDRDESIDHSTPENWRERKQAYLDHLKESTDEDYLLVSCADKLHNARAILSDYRELGPCLWARFNNNNEDEQLWYYWSLSRVFLERLEPGNCLAAELCDTVGRLLQHVHDGVGESGEEDREKLRRSRAR
jgi:(p)ppGpp synthase/HD superfamily hydrolase